MVQEAKTSGINFARSGVGISTLKNTAYSFFGYSLPVIYSIAITPVIIRGLGITDYGILVIINTINGFLGLVDLGIGLALIKYASEYRSTGEMEKLKKLVGSINFLFIIFGMLGILAYALISMFFLPAFHITAQQSSHIVPVFIFAGISFLFASLSIVPSSLLRAWQRYDLVVKISLLLVSALNLGYLAIVLLGFKLKVMLMFNLLVNLGIWLIYSYVTRSATGLRHWGIGWSWEEVKKSYRFGIGAFVTNISNNTLAQLDRLLIPAYLSPAQLSFYSLPGNVAEKINGVTGASTGVLFPVMSSLVATQDKDRIREVYRKVFRNVSVFVVGIVLTSSVLSGKILKYWVGEEFSERGAKILVILAITNGLLGLYSVLQNFLLGLGKVRFLMKASLVMAAVNIAALLVLLPRMEILGAAWAYLLSVLPIIFYFGWVEKKYIGLSSHFIYNFKLVSKLAISAGVYCVIFYFLLNRFVNSLFSLLMIGALCIFLYPLLYWVFGFFETEDIKIYSDFIKAAYAKVKRKEIRTDG